MILVLFSLNLVGYSENNRLVIFGMDAIVELTDSGRPTGKLIALQIKGGDSNFYETKNALTFYFSESHYSYWKNLIMPILIIIQDSKRIIYWQIFSDNTVIKTKKRNKINIPKKNLLNKSKDIN